MSIEENKNTRGGTDGAIFARGRGKEKGKKGGVFSPDGRKKEEKRQMPFSAPGGIRGGGGEGGGKGAFRW